MIGAKKYRSYLNILIVGDINDLKLIMMQDDPIWNDKER
jgi:hypothetical protein